MLRTLEAEYALFIPCLGVVSVDSGRISCTANDGCDIDLRGAKLREIFIFYKFLVLPTHSSIFESSSNTELSSITENLGKTINEPLFRSALQRVAMVTFLKKVALFSKSMTSRAGCSQWRTFAA